SLPQFLTEHASKAVNEVDLSEGARFLDRAWGVDSLCDWGNNKFRIDLTAKDLDSKDELEARELIVEKVRAVYRQKEIDFPVQVAMSSFMAEKATGAAGQQRYNREGLYTWAPTRFAAQTTQFTEKQFRTESRAHLREMLLKISADAYTTTDESEINTQNEEAMSGTRSAEAADAQELIDWMKKSFQIEVEPAKLIGRSPDAVRQE